MKRVGNFEDMHGRHEIGKRIIKGNYRSSVMKKGCTLQTRGSKRKRKVN